MEANTPGSSVVRPFVAKSLQSYANPSIKYHITHSSSSGAPWNALSGMDVMLLPASDLIHVIWVVVWCGVSNSCTRAMRLLNVPGTISVMALIDRSCDVM